MAPPFSKQMNRVNLDAKVSHGKKIVSYIGSLEGIMANKAINVKCSRYRPGVAQRVGRGTRRGWVVSSMRRPQFTPRKDTVPILQEALWAPGPVWTSGKSRPTGIRSRTVQPVVSRYTDWATGPTLWTMELWKVGKKLFTLQVEALRLSRNVGTDLYYTKRILIWTLTAMEAWKPLLQKKNMLTGHLRVCLDIFSMRWINFVTKTIEYSDGVTTEFFLLSLFVCFKNKIMWRHVFLLSVSPKIIIITIIISRKVLSGPWTPQANVSSDF